MIHWFKKHPTFLYEESRRLASDPYYREIAQARDNLFLSHGKIVVRRNKIDKFYFLIVYTNATPYALPKIYPLKHSLSEERVKLLSKLNLDDLDREISSDIIIYPNIRHQNPFGELCILEWDNLDTGTEFYGIATILSRLHEWCIGTITGNFPLDNMEVEVYAHFKKRDRHTKFVYSDSFMNAELREGECYSVRTSDSRSLLKAYFGKVLCGFNRAGVYDISLPAKPIHSLLITKEDFVVKKELVNELISDGEILRAYWFDIDSELPLFQTFNELVGIVGQGSYDQGLERICKVGIEGLKGMPEVFFFGIRYPNRRAELEFQLFKMKKNHDVGAVLFGTDLEYLSSIAPAYEFAEAIESEKFTEESFFMRNSTRATHSILKDKAINFFGVGAIGGELADTLGKAGIGNARLIDNQAFKAHNTVRHVVGFKDVGLPKVDAVENHLRQYNPYIRIVSFPFSVLDHDISYFAEQGSLSVSSIADDNVEGFLNEQAVITNKEMFYVRALRGGKVGRIFRVTPGKDACFHCLNIYRTDGNEFIGIAEDTDLPTLKNECNNPIRPASAADLKIISSIASRIIIDHLQDGPSEHNHWLWSTEDVAPLKRYQLHEQFIPVHPQCQYCNHDRKFKIRIESEALDYMRGLVMENNAIETGGVLVGMVNSQDGIVHVKKASDPGFHAVRTARKFEKDIEHCQEFLEEHFQIYGQEMVYIGEWHSHPSKNNSPSATDIRSLTEISYQKDYITDMPLMIILSDAGEPSATIHPIGKSFYHCEIEIIN